MPIHISISLRTVVAFSAAILFFGCVSQNSAASTTPTTPPGVAAEKSATTTNTQPAVTAASAVVATSTNAAFRVRAGVSVAYTNSEGKVWLPDQGFEGGDVIERDASTVITNTKDPALFLAEHYGMSAFSCKIPNGKYLAKLYFAETFDGVTGPGQRVFSFKVQGQEFKDFDVWAKAGSSNRAYIETIPVTVTNGIFRIDFTAQVENPEINAIELIPQS